MATIIVKADPNCKYCAGAGYVYDSYWGSNSICSCHTGVKCNRCKDTGYYNDSYTGTTVCIKCELGKTKSSEQTYKLDNAKDGLAQKNKPGLEIVPASLKQLQIDYDTEEIPEQFNKMLPILRERFGKR